MKNKNKGMKKIGICIFLILMLLSAMSLICFAADNAFESSISAFPESYKPYLRALHEKYPEWEFIPFETGLDWDSVIKNEYGDEALVSGSSASKIFKSTDSDDYNFETGKYVSKDGGFVQGNAFALEYFMDPRNFLNEDGIFMFEVLKFNENYSVEMIERVLKGSFMSKAKIEYLRYNEKDKSLTQVKTEDTYAQIIYEAGKAYDINPCYLASKILNEVGNNGSYSIYGDHPTYPGIYNFYNIGATDGSGAIARGLLWAKGGSTNKTTYGRPWNTPHKSIMGGAQFLAEEYIAKGQYTGYLQRFNVNPDGYYKLYTHQYMTNLTGALSQGYTTYCSYAALGMLDGKITFSIPVFKNMSGESNDSGTVTIVDSKNQYGSINSSKALLKTGPAKSYADVRSSSGSKVTVGVGTKIKIISKDFTDSKYYLDILSCPIWYKVRVTVGSETAEGYVDGDFVDITTRTNVIKNSGQLHFFKSNPQLSAKLMTLDYRYCTVNGTTASFVKNGTVYLVSYNSNGDYDKVRYSVGSSSSEVSDITVSSTESTVKVTLGKNADASKYGFYLKDANDKFVKGGDITSNSYTFKNLKSSRKYTVLARYVPSSGSINGTIKAQGAVTRPDRAENLYYTFSSKDGVTLKWDTAERCTGYKIYSYDKSTGKYTRIGTVTSNKGSFNVPTKYENETCFMVRAYSTIDGITAQSLYSDHLEISQELAAPAEISVSDISESGYTLSWAGTLKADGYCVYALSDKGEPTLLADTAATTVKITNLSAGNVSQYTVRAYENKNGKINYSPYSEPIKAYTLPQSAYDISFDVDGTTAKLQWNKTSGADFYEVSVYDKDKNEYSVISTNEKNSASVKNLKPLKENKICVRAATKTENGVLYSQRTEIVVTGGIPYVTGVKVSDVSADSYTLSWDKLEGAAFYTIYKLTDGAYEKIVNTTVSSYTLKELESSTKAFYKISASYLSGSILEEGVGTELSAATKPGDVRNLKGTVYADKVKLSWNKVKDADCYNVYLYKNGSYKLLKTVTGNSYTVEGLKPVSKQYVRVRAYIRATTGTVKGSLATYSFITKAESITSMKASNVTASSYTLTWNASSAGVNKYNVYRYDESTGKYKNIGSTAETSFTVKKLKPGTTYKYCIIPYVMKNGEVYTRGYKSEDFSFSTILQKVSGVKASSVTRSSLTLSWDKCENASFYRIYRYDSATKKYIQIGTTKKSSFNVSSLSAGKKYYFKLRAVRSADGKNYYGHYSDKFTVSTKK